MSLGGLHKMKLTISGGRKAPTVESAIELHRKLVYYLLNYIYTIILECLNEYKLFSRNIKEKQKYFHI